MKAYVLMQVKPMKLEEVAEKVRGRGAGGGKCTSIEIVTGPYDLTCLCEGPDPKAISACVLKCCAVAGVQRTTTCQWHRGLTEMLRSVAAVACYALGHRAMVGRSAVSEGKP